MSGILDQIGLTAEVLARAARRESAADEQVKKAFGYKWKKRETYDNPELHKFALEWLTQRYFAGDITKLDVLLGARPKVILDAGCGSALSASLLFADRLKAHHYVGLDISESIEVARTRFQERGWPADFVQWSLTDVPIKDGSLDMVFSEGVLTFTESTGASIAYLSRKLKEGGHFLFYVYAKKGAIREFTDDHVRHAIAGLDDDAAWQALMPLTRLGESLGKLGVTLEVPEDIPYLGVKKGPIDIQRFFYWYVCKALYRPEFDLDTMNLVNFDWYRPITCHRHTADEVKGFCEAAYLRIDHMDVQEAGITVVGTRTR